MKIGFLILVTAGLFFTTACSNTNSDNRDNSNNTGNTNNRITIQERGEAKFRLNWSNEYIGGWDHDSPWRKDMTPKLYGDVESVTIRSKGNCENVAIYKFNSRGDASSEVLYSPGYQFEHHFDYTYDKRGKAIDCTTTYVQYGSEYTHEYEYDIQGNIKVGEIYEYDSNGMIVKSTFDLDEEIYISTFDGNGNKVSMLTYSVEDIPDKTIYYYDEKGRLAAEMLYVPNWESRYHEYKLNSVTQYEYDALGYMIKSVRHWFNEESHRTGQIVKEFKYDYRGNIIDDGENTYEIVYRSNDIDITKTKQRTKRIEPFRIP